MSVVQAATVSTACSPRTPPSSCTPTLLTRRPWLTVGQRHFNPLFLARFSPVFRRFSAVSRHLASWRQDGESALKLVVLG